VGNAGAEAVQGPDGDGLFAGLPGGRQPAQGAGGPVEDNAIGGRRDQVVADRVIVGVGGEDVVGVQGIDRDRPRRPGDDDRGAVLRRLREDAQGKRLRVLPERGISSFFRLLMAPLCSEKRTDTDCAGTG
jgi:hypothetical protein